MDKENFENVPDEELSEEEKTYKFSDQELGLLQTGLSRSLRERKEALLELSSEHLKKCREDIQDIQNLLDRIS